jgi:hypothetical protein
MEPLQVTRKAAMFPAICRWRWFAILLVAGFLGPAISLTASSDWQSSLSKEPPGNFPPLRPLHARYGFGWSGFTAATADVSFSKISPDRFQIQGTGRTLGLVRALWKYDVTYRALATSSDLRPIESNQVETARSKKVTTHLVFSATGVRRFRTEGS